MSVSVCVCDVPVDKFAVCVWLLSACGSMYVCLCVLRDRGVLKVGGGREGGVIFTTKSANGAKLLALQVCNAIAAKSTSKKKKKKQKGK